MLRPTWRSGRGIARSLRPTAILVLTVCASQPAAAQDCWGNHPRAERAFRDGFEAFSKGEYERAIERFRESRDDRREPDGSCTVQLYGRGLDSKAYYLPYYYLGRAFYEGRDQLPDSEFSCPDAVHYIVKSLEFREETFDLFRRRFRSHLTDIDDLLEACGADSERELLAGLVGTPNKREGQRSGGR